METTWWTQPEQLDDAQRSVVALPIDESHLVVGPPGSGKTNLLVLRAAHLFGAGKKHIVLLTFGRVLREFLASGATNYVFPPSYIKTYVKWGSEVLSENGVAFDDNGSLEVLRRRLLEGLRDVIRRGGAEALYDCILIDEVQDYTADEVDVISKFSRLVMAVGDSRQSIYSTTGAIEALRTRVDQMVELPFHYRNGLTICRVADGIMNLVDDPEGLEQSAQYDEKSFPSTVSSYGALSIREQIRQAIPEIQTQLRAYPDGIIGCLTPRLAELDVVWEELENSPLASHTQLQKYASGYSAFDPSRRIVATTIHGAKGLEFRALHLLGLDFLPNFQDRQRRLAYTGVTRAKTSLSIYHRDALPGYMNRGLSAATNEVPQEPPLAALFRPGSS